jgi:hypothetical protein
MEVLSELRDCYPPHLCATPIEGTIVTSSERSVDEELLLIINLTSPHLRTNS